MWENVLIALAFGFLCIIVVLPLLAVFVITLVDVLARQDIGFSRLVWLGAVLFVPLMGLLLYWLFRPKDFDPWVESEPQTILIGYMPEGSNAISKAPAGVPEPRPAVTPRMVPALQGGSDPEPEDEPESAA